MVEAEVKVKVEGEGSRAGLRAFLLKIVKQQ
jgi:hypothetical protein